MTSQSCPPNVNQHPQKNQQRAWELSLPGIASWVGGLIISATGAQTDTSYTSSLPLSPEQASNICPSVDLGSAVDLGFDGAVHEVRHYPQEGLVEVGDAVAFLLREIESMGSCIIYGAEVRTKTLQFPQTAAPEDLNRKSQIVFCVRAQVSGYPWDEEGDITGVRFRGADGVEREVYADVTVLCNGTGVEALAKRAG
jgi:hypothetical protein